MSIEKHMISYFNASAKDCPWLNDQITHKPLHTKAPDQFQKQVLQVSASQLLENQSSPEARQTTRSKHAGKILKKKTKQNKKKKKQQQQQHHQST